MGRLNFELVSRSGYIWGDQSWGKVGGAKDEAQPYPLTWRTQRLRGQLEAWHTVFQRHGHFSSHLMGEKVWLSAGLIRKEKRKKKT